MVNGYKDGQLTATITAPAAKGYTVELALTDPSGKLVDGGSPAVISYAGNHVPFVPTHTASASLDYRFDFSGALRSLTIGANATLTGKTYWDEANSFSQKAYALLGAHVTADFGLLSLNIWGRNLTNTRYNTFALYNTSTSSHFAQRGAPIQCGFDLRLHF